VQNKAHDAQAAEIQGAIGNASKLAAARRELALLQSRQLPVDHSGYRLGGGADVASIYTGSTARIKQLQAVIEAATKAQNENTVSTRKNAHEQAAVADAIKNHAARAKTLVALDIPLNAGNAETAASLDKLAAKGHSLSTEYQRLGGAFREVTLDVTAFSKSLTDTLGATFSYTDATDAVTTAERDLAAQVKKTGHATTGTSAKAIQNRASLEGVTKAIGNQIAAYAAQGHTAAEVDKKAASLTASFVKQGEKIGFSRKQLKPYTDALHKVPAVVKSSLYIQTGPAYEAIKKAQGRVDALQAKVDKFHGKSVPMGVQIALANAKVDLAQKKVDSYHGKTVPLAVRKELADANVVAAQKHVDSFHGKNVPLDVLNALANAHIQDTKAQLGKVPTKHDTVINTPGYKGALTNIANLKGAIAALHDKSITLTVSQRGVALAHVRAAQYSKGNYAGYATGGALLGPYAGPTADNVLYRGTPGEFVVRNGPSQRHRELLEAINSNKLPAFANGGAVHIKDRVLGLGAMDTYLSSVSTSADGWLTAQAKAMRKTLESALGAGAGAGSPGYKASAGATQWSSTVLAALRALHQSTGWLGATLRRITFESGGNPRAVNSTDSNSVSWRRGGFDNRSKGLMQTVPGTFNAYAGPYRSRGIYDPFASIYAGLNYAVHRYGSIGAIDPRVRHRGYAVGGPVPGVAPYPTADNLMIRATPGEFVVRNGPSQTFRPLLEAINAQSFASGGVITSLSSKVDRIQSFASGGPVLPPDLSAITSLLSSASYSSKDDVASATKARAAAVAALAHAEATLSAARKAHHPNAKQIAADEASITAKRLGLASATTRLRSAQASYRAGGSPIGDQYAHAVTATVATDGAFISNLSKLAGLGFGFLANQLLSQGDDTAHQVAAQAVKWSKAKLTSVSASLLKSSAQQSTLALLPAELAIASALKTGKQPTLASIAASSGITTEDLQAGLIDMQKGLRSNRNASALLGGLNRTSVYAQGSWGSTTAKAASAQTGPTYQIIVQHKGNDPIRAGELAMQGVQRHAAVSFGRW
jgi:hypothetical protein